MYNRVLITEDEFDKLPPEVQIKYFYCEHCKGFYLKEKTGGQCICQMKES
jgi:hypothetical protein